MTITMTDPSACCIGGVDTHKDVHVAAVIDGLGRILGTESFTVDASGYRKLLAWLRSFGELTAVGVEGCGSYGAGLARHLMAERVDTVEVNRPNRQRRRRRGKSDTVDAEAAARAVLAGDSVCVPKTTDGPVECIRVLRVARRGARKAREQAGNQFHTLIDTAPEQLRAELRSGTVKARIVKASRFRPGRPTDPRRATRLALASVARRWVALDAEITALDSELDLLVAQTAPELVARHGIGTDTAGALLVAAGDNPERLDDDSGFAALCGTSPVEASSGKIVRHRLNRGGNREANSALWRIVIVRLSNDQRTQDYMARRIAEGKTKREVLRCLKRYVAREVYNHLPDTISREAPNVAVLAAA